MNEPIASPPRATPVHAAMQQFAVRDGELVVGGERLYHEAVVHPSAHQLHLTVVDIVVDERDPRNGSIARFPAKYRWDNKFQLLSSAPKADAGTGLSYRIDVYRRLKGRR